jgi:predicted RNase H-like HicB family nuclease
MREFTVFVYEAEEGGYWADVPELPGCASQGETLDELRLNLVDAIEAWLEVRAADGNDAEPRPALRWELAVAEPA